MYNNSIDFHYAIYIPQNSEIIIFPCLNGFHDYRQASLNGLLKFFPK